jgi:hypothetical protein
MARAPDQGGGFGRREVTVRTDTRELPPHRGAAERPLARVRASNTLQIPIWIVSFFRCSLVPGNSQAKNGRHRI